jgi:hypothetical protein
MSFNLLNKGKRERTTEPGGADETHAVSSSEAGTNPAETARHGSAEEDLVAHRHDRTDEVRGYRSDEKAARSSWNSDSSLRKSPAHDGDDHREHGTHAGVAEHESDGARERFGGINWGSAFFGWLVAIAVTVLASSVVAAVASAVGAATDFTQTQAQREAETVGLGAAIALVVVLLLGYYAGGYVAGRMSRYDGAKQGLAVWVIGLVVTLVAVGLGVLFGSEYNVLDRVDLPRIPIPTDAATVGGIITGLAVLVGTLLAALFGGKVGHRYHDKVDRAAYR